MAYSCGHNLGVNGIILCSRCRVTEIEHFVRWALEQAAVAAEQSSPATLAVRIANEVRRMAANFSVHQQADWSMSGAIKR